jgi:hypothetical protein
VCVCGLSGMLLDAGGCLFSIFFVLGVLLMGDHGAEPCWWCDGELCCIDTRDMIAR